jgi:tRNA(fMet)-specific endonuclease VapC
MTHLLDTCTCIALIRQKLPNVRKRFQAHQIGDLCISSIVESELRFGADKSGDPAKNHQQLDHLLLVLPVLPYDRSCAAAYGKIRSYFEQAGTPIGAMDSLIAAHAFATRLTLVTANTREFQRVPGPQVEDWSI